MSKNNIPALGKGLDALLGSIKVNNADGKANSAIDAEIAYISIKDITPNTNQPRKDFDEQSMQELAQSIKEQGVIVPITVNRKDGKYFIIAGERRYRASKLAGLDKIPAYIRVVTEQTSMQMALIENIQREDLNAIEIALSLKALLETTHLSAEKLAQKIGKSRSSITNYVRLLNLPAEIQVALRQDDISMGHARSIVALDDEKDQLDIVRRIKSDGLSVRQVEAIVKNIKESNSTAKQFKQSNHKRQRPLPEVHLDFKKKIQETLKTEVNITRSQRGKGKITISFSNDKDFQRIISLLEK